MKNLIDRIGNDNSAIYDFVETASDADIEAMREAMGWRPMASEDARMMFGGFGRDEIAMLKENLTRQCLNNEAGTQDDELPASATNAIAVAAPTQLARPSVQQGALQVIQQAQLDGVDEDEPTFESLDQLPQKMRNDPEYKRLFDLSCVFVYKKGVKDSRHIENAMLSDAACRIPPDHAYAVIAMLGVRNMLSPVDTYFVAIRWHYLRSIALFAAGGSVKEWPPDQDKLDETDSPTDSDMREKIRQAMAMMAPVEAANALALPGTKDDRELVSSILGVDVADWVQVGVDRPHYSLILKGGRSVRIGTVDDVLSQHSFRRKLYSAERRAFPKLRHTAWLDVCNALGRICRVAEVDEGERENVFDTVQDLFTAEMGRTKADAVAMERAFTEGDDYYTRAGKHDAETMRKAGFSSQTVNVRWKGKPLCRSYWRIGIDRIPQQFNNLLS